MSVSPYACPAHGSCNFEQDLCAWTPSNEKNNFDWYRLTSKQIALLYNDTDYPTEDTTTNSPFGHFLWAGSNFRNNRVNQSSYLYSEILPAYQYQGGACLTFSYFVSGYTGLRAYSRLRPAGQNASLLWSIDGDRGNQWFQEAIDIPVIAADFEVNHLLLDER